MVALQNLNKTDTELQVTQNRINTGMKIASAKDDGAVWAIAQNQRSTANSLNAVKDSLNRGISTVDVAMSASESISDLLSQMKSKALAASDVTLDTSSRKALNDDFKSMRDQIKGVIANASFNGANMISAAADDPTDVKALASADGENTISISAKDLSFETGGALEDLASIDFTDADAAKNSIDTLNTAINDVSSALAAFGTGSKALSNHLGFVTKLQDTITAGVGNLVDADLAQESAKLNALQTKQQLGVQALSIANQSSGILMSLFR